jgi:hypothetical protein
MYLNPDFSTGSLVSSPRNMKIINFTARKVATDLEQSSRSGRYSALYADGVFWDLDTLVCLAKGSWRTCKEQYRKQTDEAKLIRAVELKRASRHQQRRIAKLTR